MTPFGTASSSGRIPIVLLLLIAILIASVILCPPPETINGATLDSDEVPECPHAFQPWQDVRGDTVVLGDPMQIPGVGARTPIPEYHDCQRFRVPNPNSSSGYEYGALYAVYGSLLLDTMVVEPAAIDEGARASGATTVSNLTISVQQPVLAAVVYSYSGTYPRLGIQDGFNCLYFTTTQPVMVPQGSNPDCPLSTSSSVSGTRLELRVTEPPVRSLTVARWDWDDSSDTQYIGLGCGGAWCEVGAPGFISSAPFTRSKWGFRGKGWYDQQWLAVTVDRDSLIPGANMQGTVVPAPSLSTYNPTGAHRGEWREAGEFFLDTDPRGEYRTKLGILAGTEPNDLEICHGDRRACAIPQALKYASLWDRLSYLLPPPMLRCHRQRWWTRVVTAPQPSGMRRDTTYLATRFRLADTTQVEVPPVLRLRWKAVDETIWVPCVEGCCEPDG